MEQSVTLDEAWLLMRQYVTEAALTFHRNNPYYPYKVTPIELAKNNLSNDSSIEDIDKVTQQAIDILIPPITALTRFYRGMIFKKPGYSSYEEDHPPTYYLVVDKGESYLLGALVYRQPRENKFPDDFKKFHFNELRIFREDELKQMDIVPFDFRLVKNPQDALDAFKALGY